jgi:hypothetical protein
MSFVKSKHSGWTWELKRTPFGGSGGPPIQAAVMPIQNGGKGPAFNPNAGMAPQAPARDVVQETMQQRQQDAQAQAPTPMPQQAAPVQQTPVSPLMQQQMQQQMPQQMMRGLGYGQQQSGLQSMLARILGFGGGGGYMPQGYGQQMGMPNYGRFGGPQGNPMAYRPDMRPAMNNTGNVAVSVAEQQRRALQAQLDAANAQLAQQSGGGGE